MNKILLSFLLLCSFATIAAAQNTPPAPDAEFQSFIRQASAYDIKNPGLANAYYKKALEKAATDEQKAAAQIGIGKSIALREKNDDPRNDNAARVTAFQTVLDLPGASTTQKIEARLGLANTQAQLEQYDTALGNFQSVADNTDASIVQKASAQLGSGETLVSLKRYDEARSRLEAFVKAAQGSPSQNTAARRVMARSYLAQNNGLAAQAELKKIAAEPGLKDEAIALIYRQNGDFLREQKQPALAREAYQMIPPLAEASIAANLQALLQIGATYFDEKNYAKARETWAAIPDMRGSEALRADAWHSIGVAYTQEKNYAAARDAFGEWRKVKDDIPTQVVSWETIAATYIEEKNYAEARNALSNVGKLGNNLPNISDKAQLNLREKIGVAQVYKEEGNYEQTSTVLKEMLAAVPVSANGGDPSYYYDVRKQVKTLTDAMAKEPASMPAAYTVYEAWEKAYPYEFNKAEANMAMGDILAAQGKKEEAKAKYTRVIELRKNYDDAKIAQSKIDKLDGKAGV